MSYTPNTPRKPGLDDSHTDTTEDEEGQLLRSAALNHHKGAETQTPSIGPGLTSSFWTLLCALLLGSLLSIPLLLILSPSFPSSLPSLISSLLPPPSAPTPWHWPPSSTDWSKLKSFNSSLLPPSPPSPPRVSFILRAFSGYRQQMGFLFHSMELFLPRAVLNDTILVLDESDFEKRIATLYPPWVQMKYEGPPPLSDRWKYPSRARV